MANKHMKRFLTSLELRKIKTKTTIKQKYTPTRMTKIKQKKQVSLRIWSNWYSYTIMLVEIQNDTATLENSVAVSYKVKQILTIKPSNTILGIDPREFKTYVY